MVKPVISFIIPALNEENAIGRVIDHIKQHVPLKLTYEIIVVDHGSTDATTDIAGKKGANVYAQPFGSIGSLRNLGAARATGEVLIFIDADVLLTETWAKNIESIVQQLRIDPNILTGSWVGIPAHPSWIERFWFKPLLRGRSTHINSAHMILNRLLFERIGGFSEVLETGEDYDLSMRAKAADASIVDNPKLSVIHEGYPTTILAFVRREIWHGKGDYVSLLRMLQSKVALSSLVFIALHGTLITDIVVWRTANIGVLSAALIAGLRTSKVLSNSCA